MSSRIAQIRSGSAIVYHISGKNNIKKLSDAQKLGLEKGKSGDYNGHMSKETKRKVTGIVNTFAQGVLCLRKKLIKKWKQSPINLTFVTLTLPAKQMHDDETIKRNGLGHFLTIMQRKYKHFEYIWRAEPQKNGNIHFHIIANYYIPHQFLRNTWNTVMRKMGYLEKYAERMMKLSFEQWSNTQRKTKKQDKNELWKRYQHEKRNGFQNPNSTDIHAIAKVNDITAYVTKYICKDETGTKGRIITGRIWGMSDSLRNMKKYELIIWQKDAENVSEIKENQKKLKTILEEVEVSEIYEEKWFQIFNFSENVSEVMRKMKSTNIDFIEKYHTEQTEIRYFGKSSAYHSLLTAQNITLPEKLFFT